MAMKQYSTYTIEKPLVGTQRILLKRPVNEGDLILVLSMFSYSPAVAASRSNSFNNYRFKWMNSRPRKAYYAGGKGYAGTYGTKGMISTAPIFYEQSLACSNTLKKHCWAKAHNSEDSYLYIDYRPLSNPVFPTDTLYIIIDHK